jgi:hypothetical protein
MHLLLTTTGKPAFASPSLGKSLLLRTTSGARVDVVPVDSRATTMQTVLHGECVLWLVFSATASRHRTGVQMQCLFNHPFHTVPERWI